MNDSGTSPETKLAFCNMNIKCTSSNYLTKLQRDVAVTVIVVQCERVLDLLVAAALAQHGQGTARLKSIRICMMLNYTHFLVSLRAWYGSHGLLVMYKMNEKIEFFGFFSTVGFAPCLVGKFLCVVVGVPVLLGGVSLSCVVGGTDAVEDGFGRGTKVLE